MNVAVIPARGGSKRIPRKNIRLFNGKPMVAWPIGIAKVSGLFEKIIVSTDDEEIASIALEHGAEVPFLRPTELADDHSNTAPVIAHAISAIASIGINPSFVCCIYPCTPFLQSQDLISGMALLLESGEDFAYSVAEYPHPVQRALERGDNGKMRFVKPEHEFTRTQDLAATYHDLGQFYWGSSDAWVRHGRMHSGAGLVLPHWRFVDIDTEDDWIKAELILSKILQRDS